MHHLRTTASLLGSLGLLSALLPGAAVAGANMRDALIMHYCIKAVNTEFSQAGKTPPAGLAEGTCTCVVQQVDARATLAQAQTICKQQAEIKYNLNP